MKPVPESILSLLMDRSLVGLDAGADAAMASAMQAEGDAMFAFELAASAALLALWDTPLEPLPIHLRMRIERDAEEYFANRKPAEPE